MQSYILLYYMCTLHSRQDNFFFWFVGCFGCCSFSVTNFWPTLFDYYENVMFVFEQKRQWQKIRANKHIAHSTERFVCTDEERLKGERGNPNNGGKKNCFRICMFQYFFCLYFFTGRCDCATSIYITDQ